MFKPRLGQRVLNTCGGGRGPLQTAASRSRVPVQDAGRDSRGVLQRQEMAHKRGLKPRISKNALLKTSVSNSEKNRVTL